MKRFLFALAIMLAATLAHADAVPLATAGIWTTSGDVTTKVCVIQGEIALNGGIQVIGKLLLPKEDHGTVSITAKDNKLRLAVSKDAWHIRTITAPLVVIFPDGTSFTFVGIGEGNTISADLSYSDVKPFIHHFTKDDTATISFPQGREQPWTMSLTGTTPTIEALSKCADTAGMTLPYPFMHGPVADVSVADTVQKSTVQKSIVSLQEEINKPLLFPTIPPNAQVSTYVPQPSPATEEAPQQQAAPDILALKILGACIDRHIASGSNYSSYDNGVSMMKIVGEDCPNQFESAASACVTANKSIEDCRVDTGIAIDLTLRAMGY